MLVPRAEEAARADADADAEADEDDVETISPQELDTRLGRLSLMKHFLEPTNSEPRNRSRASAAAALKRLKHPAERMALEQIAELEVFAEHVEALMAAEPFQLGWMHAAIHAGGECPTLEAVAAQLALPKAGGHGPRLHDERDRLRRQRVGAQPGQGRGLARDGQFVSETLAGIQRTAARADQHSRKKRRRLALMGRLTGNAAGWRALEAASARRPAETRALPLRV